MAVGIKWVLILLSMTLPTLWVGNWPCTDVVDVLWNCEDWMKPFLEEMEQKSQKPHEPAQQGAFLTLYHLYWFWGCAETLVVLTELFWLMKRSRKSDSGRREGICCSLRRQGRSRSGSGSSSRSCSHSRSRSRSRETTTVWDRKPNIHETSYEDADKVRTSPASDKFPRRKLVRQIAYHHWKTQ